MSEHLNLTEKSNWQSDNISTIILMLGFPICDWSINTLLSYIKDVEGATITSCLQSRAIAELKDARIKHNSNQKS